ncbi:MAG: hypothetical protein AABM64_07760 [Pseudomonadota bacterium]
MKISWHCAAWIVLASLAQGPIAFAHWPDQAPHQIANLGELKLEGGGVIKSNPQKLIAQGTDWRFLNELKKELKA